MLKTHVTVGVDGSAESRAAARWAAREAALRHVPLRLVHAVDWPLDPVLPGIGRQDVDRWADQALTEAAQELAQHHPDLDIDTRCLSARPTAALAAEAADAALLVLGSRGLGGLLGFLIGSVALSTVAATDTPVVLVRPGDDPDGPDTAAPSGEILVGLDVHEACDRVLAFAFEEAERHGCPLHALHGWKMPAAYGYVPFFDPENERDITRSVTHLVDDALLPWQRKFPGVEVRRTVFRGSAGEHLVEASRAARLVVVGRHRHHSPLGTHIGPAAHAVLHHSAAPVAVITHD
ncbi:universal stress protein [Streptomyces bambusae]|uniref:universal stress protein n=1 Tax=Streptomyces bambusae TaxID=1550616 RepID=UPI001CFD0470|nr:universal stress protein [Streptomyces bambusae]MCB5163873.1 universal stress protein [Streptomyces bambusae]